MDKGPSVNILQYVKTLLFLDFLVAFLGAFAGIQFYFWLAAH